MMRDEAEADTDDGMSHYRMALTEACEILVEAGIVTSQSDWSRKAGLPDSTVREFLKGRNRSMTISVYAALASAAGVSIGALLGEMDVRSCLAFVQTSPRHSTEASAGASSSSDRRTDVALALQTVLNLNLDRLKSRYNWGRMADVAKTTAHDAFSGGNATIDTLTRLAEAASMSLAQLLAHGDGPQAKRGAEAPCRQEGASHVAPVSKADTDILLQALRLYSTSLEQDRERLATALAASPPAVIAEAEAVLEKHEARVRDLLGRINA